MRTISILVLLAICGPGFSQENLAQKLQSLSVTIHASGAQGSGVVIERGGINYILTAGHVVARNKVTREIIDNGTKKTRVTFEDAKIVTELYEGGQSVGDTSLKAEVLRYSNGDTGDDLALLRIKKRGLFTKGASFVVDKAPVPVGTELLHCGSLQGQFGSNSVTTGIVSQVGRVVDGTVYDQSNCGAFPGSSGGGVFRKSDGLYVGMIVRGAGETFNLYVPTRRILSWAERNGVMFVFDPSKDVPTDKDLKSKPIEEPGSGTGRRGNSGGEDGP